MLIVPFSQNLFIKKSILFILIGFLFQACMFSHKHGYNAYFCTTTSSHEKRFLYVNEKKIGELPFNEVVPECEQMPSGNHAIYVPLTAGEHLVEIKNEKGDVIFSENLEVERTKGSASISSRVENPEWDTKVKVKDECLVIELIH